jgi:DNA-binding CsgD family transcriptional regulator
MGAGRGSTAIGAEFAALEASLDNVAAGRGCLVLIEGAAGVGKSRLLAQAAIAASARQLHVAFARAGAGPPVDLFAPWLSAAPLALLIDDAHRAEPAALEALLQLARGIRGRPLLLGLALRRPLAPALSEALARLPDPGCVVRIVLRPLTPDAVRGLIRTTLPGASRAFCYEAFTLTAGNPFLLRELIGGVTAAGLPPLAGVPERVLQPLPPRAAREFVARALEELGPAATTLARLIATAESELSLQRATTLAGLEPGGAVSAADALLEAGLLTPGEPLRLAIPMVRHCLRSTLAQSAVRPEGAPRQSRTGPAADSWLQPDRWEPADEEQARLARAWRALAAALPAEHIAGELTGTLAHGQSTRPNAAGEADEAGERVAANIDAGEVAALALLDRFEDAEDRYVKASGRIAAAGLNANGLELALALSRLRQGQLQAALAAGHSLLCNGATPIPIRTLAAIIAAHARRERDEIATALALLGEAAAWTVEHPHTRVLLVDARGWLALCRRDLATAARLAAQAGQLADEQGIENPILVAWRPLAALCHQAAGERPRAREMADQAVALAERLGVPSALAFALRTRARTRPERGAIEDLERAWAALAGSGAALERARTCVDYGAALHRAGRHVEARTRLREGLDLAARLGARRLSRRARMILVAAGARPRRTRLTGPEALTDAERRVVELAKRGLSNPAIAMELVVTRKTVEWHLSKAYAKLGIASRRELAGAARRGQDDLRAAF